MSTLNSLRVFVVDDEPVIASTLTLILMAKGYSARSFTDPFLSLQAAETDKPDILIADITMPNLSGIHLAVKLRALYPAMHVLLISGLVSVRDQLAEVKTEGSEFEVVTKPVHPEILLSKVEAFSRRSAAAGQD